MHIRKKMILYFSILSFVVCSIFGIIYYRTIRQQYRHEEKQMLSQMTGSLSQQFEQVISQMELQVDELLLNKTVIDNLKILSNAKNISELNLYCYAEAFREITAVMSNDYLRTNFNRAVIFMQNGITINSTGYEGEEANTEKTIRDISWLHKMVGQEGKYVFVKPHVDDWSENGIKVFSVVREILGNNLGYIEVQKDVDFLENTFQTGNENWDVYLFYGEDLVWGSNEKYTQLVREKQKSIFETGSLVLKEGKYLICGAQKADSDFSVLLIDHSDLSQFIMKALKTTVAIWGLILAFLSLAVVFLSKTVSKPIEKVIQVMNKTELDSIENLPELELSDPEINRLYYSYRDVMKRLKQSTQKEQMLLKLKKQVQYDLLQAQVNPHFLFNVLNVIAGKGALDNDEAICDICACLAEMLRFSTNVKEKSVAIREEIHYLELYLKLLKYRYEDLLKYQVFLEGIVAEQLIPKMALQQIVENSITHGFKDAERKKEISVYGNVTEDGWILRILDNGDGIEEKIRKELYQKIEAIKKNLQGSDTVVEMEIGGMGLINTYARIYEIYGERFSMQIDSNGKGTCVSLIIQNEGGNDELSGAVGR